MGKFHVLPYLDCNLLAIVSSRATLAFLRVLGTVSLPVRPASGNPATSFHPPLPCLLPQFLHNRIYSC